MVVSRYPTWRVASAQLALACSALLACGEHDPRFPESLIQPLDPKNAVVVPYPPPPARLTTVPPIPKNPECVWKDGEWTFDGDTWQWSEGTWLIPPPDCNFTPPRLAWTRAEPGGIGKLLFWPGRLVNRTRKDGTCPPPQACGEHTTTAAASPKNEPRSLELP